MIRLLWKEHNNNNTTIILWPFVRDYPGELVREETFTHPPSWSSSNLYQLHDEKKCSEEADRKC